ncbi:hypothetical protein E2562_021447 [Oryza meyeriana var. granulata]|uniref:Uncharacterized protein n=1 Tax=Oryza meyeriana var. granulata TaxID=110450 RepID=A0A6G1C7W3_9ORYZ|nr:hypothetical protein E2562_021447 [Oryza meyeriana var. granulata]
MGLAVATVPIGVHSNTIDDAAEAEADINIAKVAKDPRWIDGACGSGDMALALAVATRALPMPETTRKTPGVLRCP